MLTSFRKFCKYIYETISERFENIYSINKHMLENENMNYCRMQDGGFSHTEPTESEKDISEKIKSRMESYRK